MIFLKYKAIMSDVLKAVFLFEISLNMFLKESVICERLSQLSAWS